MDDIAKIAERLTKAQRSDTLDSDRVFFWSADGRTARGMRAKGLVEPDGLKWVWTPLGEQVRNHLSERM